MPCNPLRSCLRLACVLALLVASAAAADRLQRSTWITVEGGYLPPDNWGYGVADGGFAPICYDPVENPDYSSPPDEGRDLGSPWGSAAFQVSLSHRLVVPLLAGEGALTRGNNLAVSFTGALTPVSVRLETQAALTPIAFLNVFAGGMIGTGWDIGWFNGMGLNTDGSGTAESASFRGVVSHAWVGAALQFDLAAVLPGDWHHVVLLASPKLRWAAFSGAQRGEAWMWEADAGENFNGLQFHGTLFAGYRPPLVLDTVGLLVETTQNLGYVRDLSPMNAGGWGSDFVQITLSPLAAFTLSERASLTILAQLRRERLYSEPTIFAAYFGNRSFAGSYWDLYRIAFSWSARLE